ncbi:putative disease resistance protein RGA1 [Hibiscus syriacus]|uniref:putative disease resistance protein RGA1 n=1 Tax=Hibiscus syriacus TaxID=106335 RepID=UPI00192465F7|nr:putative disease resistance protein RGA1 [Hibiscus syriacus]
MADVFVSSLVKTIFGTLNSLALHEYEIASNLETELQNLESTLTTIQAVLQDAEQKQWKSEAVKNWLRKLKDVAYDADDILDEFAAKALRWEARKNMSSKVSDFFSSKNSALFNFKKAHKLKQIRQRLDAVAEEKNKFHLTENVRDLETDDREWRLTSSLVNEFEIFGRNEDKENVINGLLASSSDRNDLSIYAICGMDGLGKTTLAQLVFNDERVVMGFELRIWVCVSDDFEVRKLTKAVIESIDGSPTDIKELDPLQRYLKEKLRKKRFLLVLDDVWNENNEKWDCFRKPLKVGAKGSVVMVTTRVEKVALIMATLPTYHLDYFSDNNSWLLFKQRSFLMESEEGYEILARIGKQIVQKCGGVPLAVKALGSMLRLKRRKNDWLSVKESEIWELPDDDRSGILPALRLSYDNLPSYSRQCFAYCSIFPKDSEMDKSQLIELWIANGFVHCRGRRDLHEIGDEIFLELTWRSFFQEVKEDNDGTVTCKMHDLVHDLAISIMRFECYMYGNNECFESPKKIRHLHIPIQPMPSSLHLERVLADKQSNLMKSCSSVRSLILGGICLTESNFPSLKHVRALDCNIFPLPKSLGKMVHLRYLNARREGSLCITRIPNSFFNLVHLTYLNLSHSRIRRIPNSFCNLVHLTYLNLSYSRIRRLPKSTACLRNLQIMKLVGCWCLRELPQGMKHMRSLKCVDLSHRDSLERTPPGIGNLTQLLELSIFIVRKDHGCGIGELKELDLGKELSIKELDNVTGSTEAKSANLIRKSNLRSLSLLWGKNAGEFPDNEEEVLGCLQPHSNLEYLRISCYQGLRLPAWLIDLPNLVSVELDQCKRCSHLPPLGELPLLKVLKIRGMDAVKCISNEFYGNGVNPFPSLEELYFESLPILEKWKTVDGRGDFPRLQMLIFRKWPQLIELPTFPTLRKLRIWTRKHNFLFRPDLGSLEILDLSSLTIFPSGLLQNHTHLEELTIESLPDLKSLSNKLDNLSMLKHLTIRCCNKVEDIPEAIQNLNALESLALSQCHSLVSFPGNGSRCPPSIRVLEIMCCDRFA